MVVNYATFWVSSGVVVRSSSGGKSASGVPAGVPGRRTIPVRGAVAADAHGLPRPALERVALGAPNATSVAVAVAFLAYPSAKHVGVFFSQNAVLFAVLPVGCGHALPRVVLALHVILVLLVIPLMPYILRKAPLEVASPLPFLWETRP